MGKFICCFLIFLTIGLSPDAFARKKKIKLHRLTVVQYDDSRVKGILYDVNEQGLVLVRAKDLTNIPFDLITKSINEGKIQVTNVPYGAAKILYVRRKGSSGRGFAIGALGSFAITALLAAGTAAFGDGCGCAGPPAVLVLPPIAGLLGGAVGSIVGLAPKKTIRLDPDRFYESADSSLRKYSLAGQLILQK
ncbi:hypothetical protein [Dyadobacter sp. CY312]|uniref:hypothetical protein n=1 Tax=Dyadobacter sp. CY312 TaxID=2907303 RepID=UPI001F48A2D2|nr:hypothetical protein [Dyadobacter sp. CY312]MCE7042917.1 hypothetical protein [Dyadobacter sp. CY312]